MLVKPSQATSGPQLMRGAVRTSPIAALTAIVVACGGEEPDRAGLTTRDSAGVRIVENYTPAWGEGEGWRLSDAPIVTIGVSEGDAAYELYGVTGAIRLPDGRIVIGNDGTKEIRFYDESGVHLLNAGGQGGGPGEFVSIMWISRYRGDSIAAFDLVPFSIKVFDSAGRFARSFAVPRTDGHSLAIAIGVFETGSVLVSGIGGSGSPGERRYEEPLYEVSPEGEQGDILCTAMGMEVFLQKADENIAGRSGLIPGLPLFGRSTEYAVHESKFYVADNDTYEVRVHGRDGALQSIVRKQHEHLVVTDADIEATRKQQLERLERLRGPQELRQARIDMLDVTPIHETMPAYLDIKVDQIGNLWVEEYRRPGDTAPRWTVFSTEGEMLGTVAVPDRFVIQEVGQDYVLGTVRDDRDVEHVQLYELIKP